VAHDHPAVLAADRDRLDLVAPPDDVAEVPEHAVDPGRDHGPVPPDQVPGGRARLHRPLVPRDPDGDGQVGHLKLLEATGDDRPEC
jgi:hypothetical protein